jgi:esterase/lipase
MEEFYARLGSSDKRMVWIERGGHLMFEDYGKEQAFTLVDEFILAHRRNRT